MKKEWVTLSLSGIFWDHRTFSNCTQPWLGDHAKTQSINIKHIETKSLNKLQGGPLLGISGVITPVNGLIKR